MAGPVFFPTHRQSFVTQLLRGRYDIRTVQELLGPSEVSTTMIYTQMLNKGGRGVWSPLDLANSAPARLHSLATSPVTDSCLRPTPNAAPWPAPRA